MPCPASGTAGHLRCRGSSAYQTQRDRSHQDFRVGGGGFRVQELLVGLPTAAFANRRALVSLPPKLPPTQLQQTFRPSKVPNPRVAARPHTTCASSRVAELGGCLVGRKCVAQGFRADSGRGGLSGLSLRMVNTWFTSLAVSIADKTWASESSFVRSLLHSLFLPLHLPLSLSLSPSPPPAGGSFR